MNIVKISIDNNIKCDTDHLFKEFLPCDDKLKNGKSILQVGARGGGAMKIFNGFREVGYNRFDVLEIYEPNWKKFHEDNRVNLCVLGDIRQIDQYEKLLPKYDVVLAWHAAPGEHLTLEENNLTIPKCIEKCNIALIVGCPHGYYEQGALKGNKWEKHLSHLNEEHFKKWKFDEIFVFNNSGKGFGPGKRNTMYAVKYVK